MWRREQLDYAYEGWVEYVEEKSLIVMFCEEFYKMFPPEVFIYSRNVDQKVLMLNNRQNSA